MKRNSWLISVALVAVCAVGGYGLFRFGVHRGMDTKSREPSAISSSNIITQASDEAQSAAKGEEATRRHLQTGLKAGDVDPVNGKKILHYHDPMVPTSKFDKPGKSPFMDMMLSPVYADGDSDQGKITISPRLQQNLGVRTAQVIEALLAPQIEAVGSIAFNERDQVIIQARASGYVEHVYVRATLDRVAKGQPLVDLYVPEWIAAQEEFLSVRRMEGSDLAVLVDAARQRMRQVGMNGDQIRIIEKSGKTQPRMTLKAPISGVVVELTAREGMTLMPGTTLFRINGLSTVWANAEVPESQAALLRVGAKVQAKSPAMPEITLLGKVQAVLSDVNASTRTLKARMELANPGERLVPGMFVQMQIMDMGAKKSLLVPTEAIIQTGRRTVVFLAEENGGFRPIDVDIGIERDGQTEIKNGLQAGQRVVVSSQFLIDSEASLRGIEARLNAEPESAPAKSGAMATSAPKHMGEGKVEGITNEVMTLSHGPISTLKWGPMTMDFKLSTNVLTQNIQPGDHVSFEFHMGSDNLPQLLTSSPTLAFGHRLRGKEGDSYGATHE